MSCILFFSSLFLDQLSDFLSSSVFPVVLVFSLKRATSSANLKLAWFSPWTLIPSESAFLKMFSTVAVSSLGEIGSPFLTHLFIGDSSDTNLCKWILAVAWLVTGFVKCLCIFRLSCFFFLHTSNMAKCLTVPKAFSYINEVYVKWQVYPCTFSFCLLLLFSPSAFLSLSSLSLVSL